MKRCVDRSDRRSWKREWIKRQLDLLLIVDRQIQEDERKAKMEPYDTYAAYTLLFAIVGLASFVYVCCLLAQEVITWLKSRKPQ